MGTCHMMKYNLTVNCDLSRFDPMLFSSVSTGPDPGPAPLSSNSVRSRNIFWSGLSPYHAAFALLFLFISSKPHFTSATKKEVIDVTASTG